METVDGEARAGWKWVQNDNHWYDIDFKRIRSSVKRWHDDNYLIVIHCMPWATYTPRAPRAPHNLTRPTFSEA